METNKTNSSYKTMNCGVILYEELLNIIERIKYDIINNYSITEDDTFYYIKDNLKQ